MILTNLGSDGVLSQRYQMHIIKSSEINLVKKPTFSVDNSENQPQTFGSTISPKFYRVLYNTYVQVSIPVGNTRTMKSKS